MNPHEWRQTKTTGAPGPNRGQRQRLSVRCHAWGGGAQRWGRPGKQRARRLQKERRYGRGLQRQWRRQWRQIGRQTCRARMGQTHTAVVKVKFCAVLRGRWPILARCGAHILARQISQEVDLTYLHHLRVRDRRQHGRQQPDQADQASQYRVWTMTTHGSSVSETNRTHRRGIARVPWLRHWSKDLNSHKMDSLHICALRQHG